MANLGCGACTPVVETYDPTVVGGPTLPVWGITSDTLLDRGIMGGPALPIKIVTDAELASGAYWLEGAPFAMPTYEFLPGQRAVQGGPTIPVYVAGGALGDTRKMLIRQYDPIAYYRLNDLTATAVDLSAYKRNGVYHATNLATMLGQIAGPYNGYLAPTFSVANNAYVEIFSAALAAAFSGAVGGAIVAVKMDNTAWTDGLRHMWLSVQKDANNKIIMEKQAASHAITMTRIAGGTTVAASILNMAETGWMIWGLRWSEALGKMRTYYQGAPIVDDSTLVVPWNGGAVTSANIGRYVGTGLNHAGGLAEVILFGYAPGDDVFAAIAQSYFRGLPLNALGDYYHILMGGQSLSNGTNGGVALSTYPPVSVNRKMSPRPISRWFYPLDEVMEASSQNLESPATAMGYHLYTNAGRQVIISRNGHDGQAYASIKKGTPDYADGITEIANAYNMGGAQWHMAGVSFIHGETDGVANLPRATYKADLEELQSDLTTDINAIRGGVAQVPLLICQMSSEASVVTNVLKQVTLGQLDAAESNPTKIFLVCPKYPFGYAAPGDPHLINAEYQHLGSYHGKALQSILATGSWIPLWPTAVNRVGAVITVTMNVPVGPLTWDTTLVPAVPNYGFEFYDDGGPSTTILSVAINGNDIVITLNATPTGANKKIRYAYTTQIAGHSGPMGNLRDSDPLLDPYGNHLYDWCVHFEKVVA